MPFLVFLQSLSFLLWTWKRNACQSGREIAILIPLFPWSFCSFPQLFVHWISLKYQAFIVSLTPENRFCWKFLISPQLEQNKDSSHYMYSICENAWNEGLAWASVYTRIFVCRLQFIYRPNLALFCKSVFTSWFFFIFFFIQTIWYHVVNVQAKRRSLLNSFIMHRNAKLHLGRASCDSVPRG